MAIFKPKPFKLFEFFGLIPINTGLICGKTPGAEYLMLGPL